MENLNVDEILNRAEKIIPIQIEEGKKLIYPFRHEEWKKYVEENTMTPNCGAITDRVLEILQAIEDNRPLEEVVKNFEDQNNTADNKDNIRWAVLTFSKNGFPFYEKTHEGYWTIDDCYYALNICCSNKEYSNDPDMIDKLNKSENSNRSRIKRLQKLEEKSIK